MRLHDILHDWWHIARDIVGTRVNGIHVGINIADDCQCTCPTCYLGSSVPATGELMSLSLFCAILDKMQKEAVSIRSLSLYLFGDPCRHPQLHEFIQEAQQRRISKIYVSTTLNGRRCNLLDVFESSPSLFVISFSGFKHYAKFHRGGNLLEVLGEMQYVAALKKYFPAVDVVLTFHRYKENQDEEPLVHALANAHGFRFSVIKAYFIPLAKLVNDSLGKGDRLIQQSLLGDRSGIAEQHSQEIYCPLQRKHIAIDVRGRVELCCHLRGEDYHLCNFLTMPMGHIRILKISHPFCTKCMASGMRILYRKESAEE